MSKLTPAKLGYFMPAEWERHDAIWLAWPYDKTTFPDRVDKAEETYISIVKSIYQSEKINLLVLNHDVKNKIIEMLKKENVDFNRVNFYVEDYADVWFRDYGPIFVVNRKEKKLAMVKWNFNAWGNKYEGLKKDTNIPYKINKKLKSQIFEPGIVLEGGSIEVNGNGTLLTTEQCLLNKNRNPDLSKKEIENYLKNYMGVRHVIWLKEGIVGDDTDGHIDDIARFVNPGTVLCAYEENEDDENYKILKENYGILMNSTDENGNKLNVIKLPMPGFVGDEEGRLPASYANFYISNKIVLAPIFGHENDKMALDIIQKYFPERKVVGINCRELVYGLGTLHCISQQQPAIYSGGT